MLTHIRPALVLLAFFTLVTGLLYPLAMTGIGQSLFPRQAGGSLIEQDGKVIGSSLIAQNFTQPQYFLPRPSAAVPVDAVTTSGSGLDPHISPANAARQIPRVAEARGLTIAEVQSLVEAHTERPWLGFLGQPGVNVLTLNMALDKMKSVSK